MKRYKYKEYKEKNAADAPKLSKRIKRAIEGSNRTKAKAEVAKLLIDEPEDKSDLYTELEIEMSDLCMALGGLLGKNYRCTCPLDYDKDEAVYHIELMKGQLAMLNIMRLNVEEENNRR